MPEEVNGKSSTEHTHQKDRKWPLAAERVDPHRQRVLAGRIFERPPLEVGKEQNGDERADDPR